MKDITDREQLKNLRDEGIRIDEDGYYSFSFGDKKEYELCVEPFGEEGSYLIAIYKNRVLLNHKLPIWTEKKT